MPQNIIEIATKQVYIENMNSVFFLVVLCLIGFFTWKKFIRKISDETDKAVSTALFGLLFCLPVLIYGMGVFNETLTLIFNRDYAIAQRAANITQNLDTTKEK